MKKNVIALLLAVVMVSGNVGTVPALAAESTAQEAVAVEEEQVSEEQSVEEQIDAIEESEDTDAEVSTEDASVENEDENADISDEVTSDEVVSEAAESTAQESVNDSESADDQVETEDAVATEEEFHDLSNDEQDNIKEDTIGESVEQNEPSVVDEEPTEGDTEPTTVTELEEELETKVSKEALFGPSYNENAMILITSVGQVVDTITYRGITVNAVYRPWYNGIDDDTTYNCAAFVKRFYSQVYGVSVSNLMNTTSVPAVSSGYFSQTNSPMKGDIVRYNNETHWAIVKSVSGTTVTLIHQNAWYASKTKAQVGTTIQSTDSSATFFRYSGYLPDEMSAPKVHGTYPTNIGEEFYAYIRNQSENVYLTNQRYNIAGETFSGEWIQVWRFKRQSNGAYSISSAYDDACMDVLGLSTENGANVYAYNGGFLGNTNQEFYIYAAYGAYYFCPVHTNGAFALDMSTTTHNLEMWGVGADWAPQEFDIFIIPKLHDTYPTYLGDSFYAYIRNQSENVYLTNQRYNIAGETFSGSSTQIWRFRRENSGAYSISSAYDDACMDVLGLSTENGANVYAYNGGFLGNANQEFYIYTAYGAYYLIPVHTNGAFALDMSTTTHNLEMWGVGADWAPQEFDITEVTYKIQYNANGGSNAPAQQIKHYKTDLVLQNTKPVRDGYVFLGWSTNSNAVTSEYSPGASYKQDKSITLYAVWENSKLPQLATPVPASVTGINGGVTFKWNAVSGANKYQVFRKTGTGGWAKLAVTTATSYTDKTVIAGTKYTYTVRCLADDGKTYVSGYNSTGKIITYTAAPTLGTVTNTATGVKFTWKKPAGAVKYRVFRKTGAGGWTRLVDTTALSYVDKSVKSGTKYTYTVRCITSDGKYYTGGYNTTGKFTVYEARTAISSLASGTAGKMTVKWKRNSKANGYLVQYSKSKTFSSGNKIATITKNSTISKTIGSLTKGKKYYVRVRCFKTVSGKRYYSAWSATKAVTVKK